MFKVKLRSGSFTTTKIPHHQGCKSKPQGTVSLLLGQQLTKTKMGRMLAEQKEEDPATLLPGM